MTSHRRHGSPTGPRIYLDAPRASTGTMLTSTYEPRYDSRAPRASFSAVPSSSTSSGRNSTIYEPQPVKRVYEVNPNSGSSKAAHVVRSRRDSNTVERRQPLNVLTKNVSPTREYFESPREVSYKDQARLLPPGQSRGSAHHQRHNSATRAETGRFFPQPGAPRVDREYHKRGPYVERVAGSRSTQSNQRYEEPSYEYTNAHEQFDRDFPTPVPASNRTRRESLTRRERPSSAIGSRFENLPFRRESATPRNIQPVDRDDRRSGFESGPDRGPRHSSQRHRQSRYATVVHQRDEGYSSSREEIDNRRALVPVSRDDEVAVAGSQARYRDAQPRSERDRDRPRRDYDREGEPRERHERRMSKTRNRDYEHEKERDRREYERVDHDDSRRYHRPRTTRDRDESSDRSGGLKGVATAALGGLAAAGVLGSGHRKDTESDSDTKREHRRRHRHKSRDESQDAHRERDHAEPEPRRKSERRERRQDSSGSDTPEEAKSHRRPQSRTRQRSSTVEGYTSEPERRPAPMDVAQPQPTNSSNAKDPVLDRAFQESPVNSEGRTISPGEGVDGRPRKVSIVEPGKDARGESRPKSILKPPRAVPFPEDPNPQREGVAPLKQAGKDGVPTGARWTKISRILVNPEALERAHERFEERDDYVIVLRVMSREEIEKLAEKTREIRETREREWQKEVEERKRRRAERGARETDDEYDDDDDEHRQQPLAIEPPPNAPPADLKNLVQQSQQNPAPPMAHVPQTGYGAQQVPHPQERQQAQQQYTPSQQQTTQPQAPLWQGQPQWAGQAQYQPQWNSSGPASARSSAERLANTAPGQPVPSTDAQKEQGSYSQNV